MGKRNRQITQAILERWKKQGRGQGRGKNYRPHITIHDIASMGLSSRDYSPITGRIHHLLSRLEFYYYLILNWIPNIVDIREQFPLDVKYTWSVAEHLKIRHPFIIGSKPRLPYVMTTDFLITIRIGNKEIDFARDIKYSKSLLSARTLDKLEIARHYWAIKNTDYGVLTEHEISRTFAMNVDFIRRYTNIDQRVYLDTGTLVSIAEHLTLHVLECNLQLRYITEDCDAFFNLKTGTSLTIAYHLIANHLWAVDMEQEINPSRILQLTENNFVEIR